MAQIACQKWLPEAIIFQFSEVIQVIFPTECIKSMAQIDSQKWLSDAIQDFFRPTIVSVSHSPSFKVSESQGFNS